MRGRRYSAARLPGMPAVSIPTGTRITLRSLLTRAAWLVRRGAEIVGVDFATPDWRPTVRRPRSSLACVRSARPGSARVPARRRSSQPCRTARRSSVPRPRRGGLRRRAARVIAGHFVQEPRRRRRPRRRCSASTGAATRGARSEKLKLGGRFPGEARVPAPRPWPRLRRHPPSHRTLSGRTVWPRDRHRGAAWWKTVGEGVDEVPPGDQHRLARRTDRAPIRERP